MSLNKTPSLHVRGKEANHVIMMVVKFIHLSITTRCHNYQFQLYKTELSIHNSTSYRPLYRISLPSLVYVGVLTVTRTDQICYRIWISGFLHPHCHRSGQETRVLQTPFVVNVSYKQLQSSQRSQCHKLEDQWFKGATVPWWKWGRPHPTPFVNVPSLDVYWKGWESPSVSIVTVIDLVVPRLVVCFWNNLIIQGMDFLIFCFILWLLINDELTYDGGWSML